MERPLKSVTKSIRLTPEQVEEFLPLVGYRKLWTWTDIVVAGLRLLHGQKIIDDLNAAKAAESQRKPRKKKGDAS